MASYSNPMRLNIYASLVAAILLVGCAQRGVVVEKRLKPSPFAYSNGMDGIYSFLLRDEQGNVHSQMVTPDVYSRYDIGDYFDDQQAGPAHREGYNREGYSKDQPTSDSKAVKPVTHAAPHKKHAQKTAVAAHHKKHRSLRAAVKPREEESEPPRPETPNAPTAGVMLRSSAPEPQGLDVHP
jgi:hypothetical protein